MQKWLTCEIGCRTETKDVETRASRVCAKDCALARRNCLYPCTRLAIKGIKEAVEKSHKKVTRFDLKSHKAQRVAHETIKEEIKKHVKGKTTVPKPVEPIAPPRKAVKVVRKTIRIDISKHNKAQSTHPKSSYPNTTPKTQKQVPGTSVTRKKAITAPTIIINKQKVVAIEKNGRDGKKVKLLIAVPKSTEVRPIPETPTVRPVKVPDTPDSPTQSPIAAGTKQSKPMIMIERRRRVA